MGHLAPRAFSALGIWTEVAKTLHTWHKLLYLLEHGGWVTPNMSLSLFGPLQTK